MNSHQERYRFPFARYPAVRIAILFAVGIVCSSVIVIPAGILAGAVFVLLLFWGISEWMLSRKYPWSASVLALICYLMMIIAAGWTHAMHSSKNTGVAESVSQTVNLYAWEKLEISAEILESGKTRSGRDVHLAEVYSTQLPEENTWQHIYGIRLYDDQSELQPGDRIEAEVRVYEFPERRNPHEFDYGGWLLSRGVAAHGEITRVEKVRPKNGLQWNRLRNRVQSRADSLFDENRAPMAKALLLGYKEDLTPETRKQFSRSGLSHIMAVSGLHVGFIVAPFWLIIPWLWNIRYGKYIGLIMLTMLLFGYAGLTGFSASVSRASLMAWLITYGKLFHKVRDSINLLAVAALIILMIKPSQLFDVGFQLSFAAVFTILMVMPSVQKKIPKRWRYGKSGMIIMIVMISVVVQSGLYPILIYYFGEFSVMGPLANAVVIPVLSVTVPSGLAVVLLSSAGVRWVEIAAVPLEWMLWWIEQVAERIGSLEISYITIEPSGAAIFIVWILIILMIASVRIKPLRWKIAIALLLACNLWLTEIIIKKPSVQELQITFLDVGQGDAAHIVTPAGNHILVDAGRWTPGGDSGEQVLIPYFKQEGIDRLDVVILSHPHADHIGGMPSLMREIEVGKIYQSDYMYDSVLFRTYLRKKERKGIPAADVFAGQQIDIDPAVRLFVVGPEPVSRRPSNPNDYSVAFRLVYGKTSVLFTGDAEQSQERQIARRYGDLLKSDLYKVGHHASNTSSTAQFMAYVRPKKSVASLAFQNRFQHPGEMAVQRLHEFSEQQYFTSLNGAVRLVSDGEEFRKITWR